MTGTRWKRAMNYLGQFRIYSVIDLGLLGLAAQAPPRDLIGMLCLWLFAICFLEQSHRHPYRVALPWFSTIGFMILGVIGYPRVEALLAALAMALYSRKNVRPWGLVSPFVRGLFNFFIVAGLVGYRDPLTWIAFILIALRNLLGDLRDAQKDRAEGFVTLPIRFGFRRSWPLVHLGGLLVTTCVWWNFTSFPALILFLALTVEVATYDLTPR